MATATNRSKSGFFIEVTCPGCGGRLDLDSDFFVLQCTHCSSVHRIVMPDVPPAFLIESKIDQREAHFAIDRYLKKKSLPLSSAGMHLKQFYYPYWKIDAVLFRLRNKVYERVIREESEYCDEIVSTRDRTEVNLSPYTTTRSAGMEFEGIPPTIGLRTEYIRMVPFAQENIEDDFHAYPVLTTWEEMRSQLLLNLGVISDIDDAEFGSNVTELFHPRASLVYFPFLVFESYSKGGFNRYVIDGVAGRVLDHVTDIETDGSYELPEAPYIEFGALTVEHHRCNTCGVDLPPEQSFVYVCSNCHEMTVLGDQGRALNEIFCVEADGKTEDRMFPFWVMKMTPGDAARLKGLFGGIHHSDQLVIPAFKSKHFDAIARLTKRMSSAIPRLDSSPIEQLDSRFLPVSVGLDDAMMLAEITIFHQGHSRPDRRGPENTAFSPEEIKLVYVPFHREHYFYVDSAMNTITFEKSLAP